MRRVLCALALLLLLLTGSAPARAACPNGTVEWDNGHCYEAVLEPGVSWDQAQAQCVARGGHLATITSAEENAFVFSLVSGNPSFWFLDSYGNGLGAWLGGYQIAGSAGPASGWRWVTNEPFDYTNWETGQPGDMEGLEQDRLRFFKAGGLIGSRWDDCEANNPLAHRLGYIFERDSETTGSVEDGYGHKLSGVEVTLLAPSPEGSTTTAVTLTDDQGEYLFSGIDDGDYQIEIALECHKTVGDTATFSVNYDRGSSVRAQTDTFEVTDGKVARDISFADADLIPAAGIPQDRLDDLAGMYYHTKQVIDFELKELGFTPDLNLPIEVHGYVTDNPSTADDESQTCYYDDGQVYLGTADSDYDDDDRPVTREWHEMFHELMDDAWGFPPYHTGDMNHDGFYNHCTVDSWVEGWAEFWPCALKRSLGADDWYCFWGATCLEFNWQVWDFDDEVSREEFAAASVLVDLVDPVDPLDMDYISLTTGQLWSVIGSQPLANMYELYVALTAANIGQSDTNTNGKPDLDDLFIAHGFFADGGDPGNRVYDAGEDAGWGGKPGRTNTLRVPSAYLRIIVADSEGSPITSGTLVVDVVFESPLDIYNHSYEVELGGSDSIVYFEVAPDGYDPLMKMRVRDDEGNLSDEFVLSNSEYWEKVSESGTGYADEHTFVIGAEGKTTGGVPVWVWPIVGVVAIAAAAGGFFLLRRRAKPG
jgi:hypothetical protein